MCGLVGVAGLLLSTDELLMKKLLLFDYLRGSDGTGLAAIRNNGEAVISKLDKDPITLSYDMRFRAALDGAKSKIFMGHNRAATRGGTNVLNTHPFQYDHIVGAHNGTLDQASWKALENALGETYAVDSMALIAAIAKLGVKDAIELCYEGKDSSTGAWSLVWYDQIENSLNFLRNQHRPMWIAYEKDFKRIFWASEYWMIDSAIQSGSHYDLYAEGKEGFKYFPTDVDKHYKFDVVSLMGASKKPKPLMKPVKGKELPVVKTQGNFPTRQPGVGFGVPSTKSSKGQQNSSSTSTKQTQSRGKTQPSVLNWLGDAKAPFAGLIDKAKFDAIAKYGCSWCSVDIDYDDPGVSIYERDDMILCGPCSGHDENLLAAGEVPSRIYVTATVFDTLK